MKRSMTRGVFAAVVAAAMGFGAAQAVAAPKADTAAVKGCTQESCARRCAPLTGFCEPRGCWCR